MQVFKFGGASVKDADSVKNVASLLKDRISEPTIVVVSAMGKITNKLEELSKAYFNREETVNSVFEDVKSFHFSILKSLFPDKEDPIYNAIENVFVEVLWTLEDEPSSTFNFHYDQIVSIGEILSTKIVSAYLNKLGIQNLWLDVRGFIQTDNTYREGKVDYDLSEKLVQSELVPQLNKDKLIVTQGFIGGTSENYTTTLGREGSDYTAALLAYFTNASKVTIWKDVPGVLNADPKYFKNTKKIDQLTYHDAIELTYFGASVIHPKTIKPLQNKNIPLYVKSFIKPEESGTLIKDGDKGNSITSYIFKEDQILLSIQPKDFSFIAEDNLGNIFKIFAAYNVHIHMMQNSAISFSVCTDNDPQKIEPLLLDLQKEFKVLYNAPVQLMTIRNYNPEIIARLSENKVVIIEQRSRHTHQMVIKSVQD